MILKFDMAQDLFLISFPGIVFYGLKFCFFQIFGELTGNSICVLIDCSESSCYGDRKLFLQDALKVFFAFRLLLASYNQPLICL